ncbi:MAG: GyrI-like domain-containing protein [Pirellulaceae bacterium]
MTDYRIEVTTLRPQPTLSLRFSARPDELGARFGEVLPRVLECARASGAAIAGAPFGRYHMMGESVFRIEAGVPVAEPLAELPAEPDVGGEEIQASSLPGGRAATTTHVGPYEQLGEAHDALYQWAAENHETASGGSWEVYLTDPGEEPNPQNWRTRVFLPLE